MKERIKNYFVKELKEPVPPNEKGVFEPLDRLNRYTANKSRDIAVGATVTTFAAPITAPLTVPIAAFAAGWTIIDRIQGELSQTVRREVKGNSSGRVHEMKPGREYTLATAA